MVHSKPFRQQPVLRLDHIEVPIVREASMESIAWLAGLSMPNAVGENEKVAFGIEQAANGKQLAGKYRVEETGSAAARAVHNQHRIPNDALGVALGLAKRSIMHSKLWQYLTRREPEISDNEIPVLWSGILSLTDSVEREQREQSERELPKHDDVPPALNNPQMPP